MKYIEILARNALFTAKAEDYLNKLLERAINDKVKKYINKTLRNYIINEYKGTLIKKAPSNSPDWLKKAVQNNQEVFSINITAKQYNTLLHYVDFLNAYSLNKDIKFSYNDLVKKVQEWDESLKKVKITKVHEGEKIIHKYADGYTWVNVFGKNALALEGNLMGHCVGSYYEVVKDGVCEIYSLRDTNNKPHCTIEYNLQNKEIAQIQGKQNTGVVKKYIPYVQDFLNNKYVPFKSIDMSYLMHNDMVYYNNKLVRFSTLDKYEHEGDLELAHFDIDKLPNTLIVNGSIELGDSTITKLPDNLKVTESLYASYTKITELPPNLEVGKSIVLVSTHLSKLPDNLTVHKDLRLDNTNITELPKGLKVMNNLDIQSTNIKKLSKDLIVYGDLDISHTKIQEIPDSIKFGKNSYIYISKDMKNIKCNAKNKERLVVI